MSDLVAAADCPGVVPAPADLAPPAADGPCGRATVLVAGGVPAAPAAVPPPPDPGAAPAAASAPAPVAGPGGASPGAPGGGPAAAPGAVSTREAAASIAVSLRRVPHPPTTT